MQTQEAKAKRAPRRRKAKADPFDAMLTGPHAIVFTDEQWAADLERRKALWAEQAARAKARRDAGGAPVALIVIDTLNRELHSFDECEERKAERAVSDPWKDQDAEARKLARRAVL
jgi:hypothetical protein